MSAERDRALVERNEVTHAEARRRGEAVALARGWLVWLAATAAGLPLYAQTNEFRVDSEVFFGQAKEPGLEALTIFADGMVFDFVLTQPREIAILDLQRGRITLLDETRQVKSGVSTRDLIEFTLELEAHAVQRKDTLVAFAAKPQFETTEAPVDENGQQRTQIKLSGKPMEYVVLGQQPERQEAAGMYRHFADWYARLNATRPGNLPPGARLALNQALADRGLLPLEIRRTITSSNPLVRNDEVHSRHLVNWTLSGEDRKKIEQAGTHMATFKAVSYDEYRRGFGKPAPTKQAKR